MNLGIDNKTLLNRLLPDYDKIMAAPLAEDGNAIMQLTGLEYGRQGSGKTTTVKWLVEEAKRKYGPEKVNASWSFDLEALLRGGFEPVPINILLAEDQTNAKISPWAMWAFFNIRHLMAEQTGLRRGLCLIFFNCHDAHRVPKEFRLDVDGHLVKNSPTNDWDEDFYTRRLGMSHVAWLKDTEEQWVNDPTLKRYGAWYSQRSKGRFESEFIPHRNMKQIVWETPTIQQPVLEAKKENTKWWIIAALVILILLLLSGIADFIG